ncbi:MAG: phosphoribosylanthranilate isomerase [Spirochaetaceae bacterium]|nr:phosphoribosylanthranilate isomerase [Spirochaetaceae bacterium]
MPKIKVCGLFREEDADYVNEARPDYAGFVFAESRRQVTLRLAARLRKRLAEGIVPVGVFVNAAIEDVAALHRDGIIDMAQLHGGEDRGYIRRLKAVCAAPVIRAVAVGNRAGILPGAWEDADFLLLDGLAGGSGERFDWRLVSAGGDLAAACRLPCFIAGGITADNVKAALETRPGGEPPYGIDVSSGAETDGVKDRDKIIRLVELVRNNGGKTKK